MAIRVPDRLLERTERYAGRISGYSEKLSIMYKKCCLNTLETAAEYLDDGSVFVLTGDIPAMWLRDSTAEVSNYIPAAAEDEETAKIIRGVIRKQR
ncbi:MAG: glycoside hydrolase family 125 protein, partial [Clostridia bacterium]|nr:glycoside hydrolase family 125 protein [Clostridia bacterium]